ncbi:MAG: DUF2878 domain-containing protein [Alphaproteobacteria bacterium]
MGVLKNKLPMVADFVGFQILWWACIYGGANHLLYPAIGAFLLYVAAHLFFISKVPPRWQGLVVLAIAGFVVDTLLTQAGILVYARSGAEPSLLPPVWIIILWVGLGFSAQGSLSWLMGRPVIAFALFGLAGALSYRAGIAFEAAAMPIDPAIGYPLIALCFGAVGMALSSGKIKMAANA